MKQTSPVPAPPAVKPAARRVLLFLPVLAVGILIGWTVSPRPAHTANAAASTGAVQLRPGPWGNLEYVPICIAPPDKLLTVHGLESQQVIWVFQDYSRDQLQKLLESLSVSSKIREQMLDAAHLTMTNGLAVMEPSSEAVYSLSPEALSGIYKVLALSGLNDGARIAVSLARTPDQFQRWGASRETLAIFKSLSVPYKKYLMCYSLPYVLAHVQSYEQKVSLVKAVSCQNTLLLRMQLNSDSDINALDSYWGHAFWSTDVGALLDSASHTPNGTWLDVIELLPPLPSSLLYNYILPQNPMNGPVVRQDCHWTSMNFFREPPDDQFGDTSYVMEKLKSDYFPVADSDPRFGDVIMFVTPDGRGIHSAVFIADNIAFTRDGVGTLNPWMLATIDDLVNLYSFTLPADQKVELRYFRNKYY